MIASALIWYHESLFGTEHCKTICGINIKVKVLGDKLQIGKKKKNGYDVLKKKKTKIYKMN